MLPSSEWFLVLIYPEKGKGTISPGSSLSTYVINIFICLLSVFPLECKLCESKVFLLFISFRDSKPEAVFHPGNIQQCLFVNQDGGYYCHWEGQRPRKLLNTLQYTGQAPPHPPPAPRPPPTVKKAVKMSIVLKWRNPQLKSGVQQVARLTSICGVNEKITGN